MAESVLREETRMERIADCAEVLPGYALKARAEHEPEGTHQIILGQHITEELFYTYQSKHALRISVSSNLDKYHIHEGDVLFVSRGTRNCAVVVTSVPKHTVASATFYILRPKSHIEPVYLAWCLNQAPIQARVTQVRTGAGTPIVQRKIFSGLTIPVPSLATQQELAELGRLMVKERSLRRQLLERTDDLHKAMGEKLIQNLLNQ